MGSVYGDILGKDYEDFVLVIYQIPHPRENNLPKFTMKSRRSVRCPPFRQCEYAAEAYCAPVASIQNTQKGLSGESL